MSKETVERLYYEVHDIWPMSLVNLHGFKDSNLLMKFIEKKAKIANEESDAVFAFMQDYAVYATEKKIKCKSIYYLPNCSSTQKKQPAPKEYAELFQQLKMQFERVVLYCGGFERANGVEVFAQLCARLEDIAFVAVGDGKYKEEMGRAHV